MGDKDMFERHVEKPETCPNFEKNTKIHDLKGEFAFKSIILDIYLDPLFLHDLDGNFIYVNETACKFTGYTREELMQLNFYDLNMFPLLKSKSSINEIIKQKELKFQSTYFKKNKLAVPVEIHSKLVRLGKNTFILSIAQNIVEIKEIETPGKKKSGKFKNKRFLTAIKDRGEHLSLITNNMLDLIYQVNSNGIFEYVSPSIKEVLGYEVEEIMGKRDFEFIDMIHPDDFEIIMDTIQAATQVLKPKRVQHRFKHADGHYIWVETVGNPLSNNKKEFSGAVYVTRDITELKNVENQLKSSLEEKEVLLREIHHRVKNNLQIISSLLNLQSQYLKDEKVVNVLNESQNRVRSMAMVHEDLYRSQDLSKIDFADYIKRLLSGLFSSYGVNDKLITSTINVKNVFLNISVAVPCGLIINELVSNSLKHAFPQGQEGEIYLKFYHNGKKYILIIADNGIGFPEDVKLENTKSLGLKLVNTLVEQLGGNISICKDSGTSFKIVF